MQFLRKQKTAAFQAFLRHRALEIWHKRSVLSGTCDFFKRLSQNVLISAAKPYNFQIPHLAESGSFYTTIPLI